MLHILREFGWTKVATITQDSEYVTPVGIIKNLIRLVLEIKALNKIRTSYHRIYLESYVFLDERGHADQTASKQHHNTGQHDIRQKPCGTDRSNQGGYSGQPHESYW